MNKEERNFLIDLQKELNEQDHDCQAAPRFWVVGDYEKIACPEGNQDSYEVFLPGDCESFDLDDFLNEHKESDELEDDAKLEFEDIGCEISALDWIRKHFDHGADLIPVKEQHVIKQNTMFLTKQDARNHIKSNHYHYTEKAHTYAMTAWRSPKVEKLIKILETVNFEEEN